MLSRLLASLFAVAICEAMACMLRLYVACVGSSAETVVRGVARPLFV